MSSFSPPEFPITMLGARAVGKTSMITAMCDQFDKVCNTPELQLFAADGETLGVLQQQLINLKAVLAGKKGRLISPRAGIAGSSDHVAYRLTLRHTSTNTSLRIVFNDYPGGWLVERSAEVIELLEAARVILVAIDAPSLMELEDDSEHEAMNLPLTISHLLGSALEDNELQRLVIFVPMRCEKWVQEPEEWSRLERVFQLRYEKALRTLAGYRGHVAAVFAPIQTLGAVQFVNFKTPADGAGPPSPQFIKTGDKYDPRDCDQPLRYSLRLLFRALNRVAREESENYRDRINQRGFWSRSLWRFKGLFNIPDAEKEQLAAWLARAQEFVNIAQSYADGTKQTPPYRIIQGESLI